MAEKNGKPAFDKPKVSVITVVVLNIAYMHLGWNAVLKNVCPIKP